MALFTLTINNQSPALDKKYQEVERIENFTRLALQALGAARGGVTSGNIVYTGTTVGSWTYTPQASS